jgi:predicted nucleic acid-binding protein
MGKIFIDTNIIVYANDARVPDKQEIAIEVVAGCIKNDTGVISTQVLQEYANTALNKLGQASEIVVRQIHILEALEIIQPTPALIKRAVEIKVAYKISFWDAGIIAAAESADCDCIISEDLSSGHYYAGIKIKNPF